MSYIRCLSNPECLYIWGERGGKVAISVGSGDVHYVKTRNWHSLLKQFASGWGEEYYSGSLSLKEETVPNGKTNHFTDWKWYLKQPFYVLFNFSDRTMKERWEGVRRVHEMLGGPSVDYQWILRDGDKTICQMWETTMYYIAHSNENSWKKPKRK